MPSQNFQTGHCSSTQRHIPWEPGFFPGGKAFGMRGGVAKLATHNYLVSRLGMDGATYLMDGATHLMDGATHLTDGATHLMDGATHLIPRYTIVALTGPALLVLFLSTLRIYVLFVAIRTSTCYSTQLRLIGCYKRDGVYYVKKPTNAHILYIL
jgi:hypothetical protein